MGRRQDEAGRTSPSETRAAQLALVREQAGRRRLVDVARQYDADAFVAPAPIGLRLANTLDRLALDAALGFESILLSGFSGSSVWPACRDRAPFGECLRSLYPACLR